VIVSSRPAADGGKPDVSGGPKENECTSTAATLDSSIDDEHRNSLNLRTQRAPALVH
jgi:hypothetical protein